MEVKKNPKANLEKLRGTFMLTGLIVALISVSIIMGLSKTNVKIEAFQQEANANIEEEQVAVTRQDVTPPPPPPPEQQVSEVIEIVDDDVKIEDNFDFDTETDDDDVVNFEDIDFGDEDEGMVEEEPLIWAEQMPVFPGGEAALRVFIAENVEYPELAAENDIQGTVYIRFVVTKTGKVGEVQIQRGVDPLLDEEAERVVKLLPSFTPGSQGGRPVPVWFSVPIVFQLNN